MIQEDSSILVNKALMQTNHPFTSVYVPEANGTVESVNRDILKAPKCSLSIGKPPITGHPGQSQIPDVWLEKLENGERDQKRLGYKHWHNT